jgi:hypothetical protein
MVLRGLSKSRRTGTIFGMSAQNPIRLTRIELRCLVLMLACYAVGYPVAIVGHSPIGWALVTIGGVFLVALCVLAIRRIDRSGRNAN